MELDSSEDTFEDQGTSADGEEIHKLTKYNALSLTERINVLKEYDNGKTVSALMKMFDCSKAQIVFILNNRKEYINEWQNESNPQRVRGPISPHSLAINLILFEYVWRLRHYPVEVSDENLKTVGKEISLLLGMKSFLSSKRWLERFKHSYRLNGSVLLSCNIVNDNKEKKSLRLTDIFQDMADEFKAKNVQIHNLGEEHICALKSIRAMKINESLAVDPRRKKVRVTRISKYAIDHGLPIAGLTEPVIKDEADVEYVEILPDPESYESEDSKSTQDNSYMPMGYAYYPNELSATMKKDIETYGEALEHLKTLENFAMMREDLRAIGLINQLENYLKEKHKEIN